MEFFRVINVVQLLCWIVFICLLIYLVFKRLEDKKDETFEDRDN